MSVESTLRQQPSAFGFALIISNDYVGISSLPPLWGTEKDAEAMRDAFAHLNIVVLWKKNLSLEAMLQSVRETTECRKNPEKCVCIAFVFSGHGYDSRQLYTQDEKKVDIERIITEFYPKNAAHIGNVPKLFFIDVCRGSQEVEPVAVPKGAGQGVPETQKMPAAAEPAALALDRGATVSLSQLVPGEGNYLIAYSTMPDYKAYEMTGRGGIWMTTVARKLRSSRASIDDVLTEVNQEMLKKFQEGKWDRMQQPEKVSTLNRKVFLHPDRAAEIGESMIS